MKNRSLLWWMFGSVVALSAMLTACGRSNKSDNPLRGTGVVGYADTCGQGGASAVGRIYSAQNPASFQPEVANYLSSWMDPNQLGAVDGNPNSTQTRVELKG